MLFPFRMAELHGGNKRGKTPLTTYPYHPSMVYIPTFGWLGKYTIHGSYGLQVLSDDPTQVGETGPTFIHEWLAGCVSSPAQSFLARLDNRLDEIEALAPEQRFRLFLLWFCFFRRSVGFLLGSHLFFWVVGVGWFNLLFMFSLWFMGYG